MNSRTRSILLSAVLATPVVLFFAPRPVEAQYRVDNGNSNDANNRIGGGGVNEARPQSGVTGMDIATGNVTGGKELRLNLPYSAQGAFHAPLAGGNVDRFVRSSSSAYDQNAQSVHPFYGTSYGAPPPAGFTNNTTTSGAYIPATPLMRESGDLRLGIVGDSTQTQLPRAGQYLLPGQVDTSAQQMLLGASPLYGIRQGPSDAMTDTLSANPKFSNIDRSDVQDRLGVNDKTIQNMRDELRKNAGSDNMLDNGLPKTDPNDLSSKAAIQKPFESPASAEFQTKPLNTPLNGGTMQSGITADQSQRNALVPAPADQSTQYAELSKRFKDLQQGPQTDQQANNQFRQDLKARQDAQRTAAAKNGAKPAMPPGGGFPGGGGAPSGELVPAAGNGGSPLPAPSAGGVPKSDNNSTPVPAPVEPTPQAPAVAPKPANSDNIGPTMDLGGSRTIKPGKPLSVDSLTTGMKPSALRDTLTTAENQMREGKYTSALDQYGLAERVAPNNPMITLGRANAELGASYYARADADIRRAYAADGALMLAQFDLGKFLGRERIGFLEKDLKDIANTEPKSVRAPFLLAYLKFHSGDLKMASNYLALSEKRAGAVDPLYKQLRIYWGLPEAAPIPDGGEMSK